ncbi:homocysteine S-methyltransferase family protein, partial [Streptomyces sp. st115]
NAGLPVLTKDGAHFPLGPDGLADSQEHFVRDYGLSLIGGCCGTTPAHLKAVVDRARELTPTERDPRPEPGAASLYQHIPFRQDTAYLAIGERTNANGSKKFREAMLEARWDDCVEMARDQIREGAHMLDLCVDYVGRDGVADMAELAGRFA